MSIQSLPHGYDVPGMGIVPRVSTLLDMLDHPGKRARLELWWMKCAMRGMADLVLTHWDADTLYLTDWATETITDQHVDDALALGGGTWQADQGTAEHEVLSAWLRHGEGLVLRVSPAAEAAIGIVVSYGLRDAVAHAEEPAYIPGLHAAGTPDLVLVHDDDSVTIIDWKCGRPDWRRWRRQLVAYAWPWDERGYRIRDLVVVQLGVGPEPRIPEGTAKATSVLPTAAQLTEDRVALITARDLLRIATASEDSTTTEGTTT